MLPQNSQYVGSNYLPSEFRTYSNSYSHEEANLYKLFLTENIVACEVFSAL